MRVLFQSRTDLFTQRSGDVVIAEKLIESLARRSVEVVCHPSPEPDLTGIDVVHLQNVAHRDCHTHALHARRHGLPIALATVYWSQDELLRPGSRERSDYAEPLRHRLRRWRWSLLAGLGAVSGETARRYRERARYYARGARGLAQEVLDLADAILPSSPLERDVLLREFEIERPERIACVPYGVDPQLFAEPPVRSQNGFWRRHGVEGFLLCVARLEPRKNQLVLLEAGRSLGLPIVLVGEATDPAYAARVRAQLRPGDVWEERWPHERMAEVYGLARLHALVSLNDVPGLASLEAAAMGVPVVLGNEGSGRDYLGDRADYCDPRDPADVRRACEAALARPYPAESLAAHVRDHYTWDHMADRMVEVYQRIAR